MSASEIVQDSQHVDAVPAVGASARGLIGEGTYGGFDGSQKKVERELKNVDRAYPPWNEVQRSSGLTNAWKTTAERVLQQAAGCGGGGGGELSRIFKRPWLPVQWKHFQVCLQDGRLRFRIREWGVPMWSRTS